MELNTKKSDLHHTRNITPKRVTRACVAHLRGIVPGQHRNVVSVASR